MQNIMFQIYWSIR